MAVNISIGVREEEALRRWLEASSSSSETKVLALLVEKINVARAKRAAPKPAGLGWNVLKLALHAHLGDRLALPPAPDGQWYAIQTARIKRTGLDATGAAEIAAYLATWRRPTIAFEYVVNNITDLLAAARRPRGGPVGGVDGQWGLTEFTGDRPSPFDD